MTLTQMALRWILMFDAVTCAIPGAKRPTQVEENVQAADLAPLPESLMAKIQTLYNQQIRELVHHYW
jgi:aryl-alcohol dehydrogenase-like predicted oxidoreductase